MAVIAAHATHTMTTMSVVDTAALAPSEEAASTRPLSPPLAFSPDAGAPTETTDGERRTETDGVVRLMMTTPTAAGEAVADAEDEAAARTSEVSVVRTLGNGSVRDGVRCRDGVVGRDRESVSERE
jgi:hypothetical protein